MLASYDLGWLQNIACNTKYAFASISTSTVKQFLILQQGSILVGTFSRRVVSLEIITYTLLYEPINVWYCSIIYTSIITATRSWKWWTAVFQLLLRIIVTFDIYRRVQTLLILIWIFFQIFFPLVATAPKCHLFIFFLSFLLPSSVKVSLHFQLYGTPTCSCL